MSVTNFQLDLPEFKDDCLSIASSVSSNKSSKSFRSRLRERFVFSNSNSKEVGHKALEIDLENKNLKIENLEKELDLKNKEIKELELEKNELLDGILEMNNKMSKFKTKLAEKEVELSQIKAQKLDREEISCIKTLLQSQKESIIQSCMEMCDSKGPGLISDGMFTLHSSSKYVRITSANLCIFNRECKLTVLRVFFCCHPGFFKCSNRHD